jgi:hypothetical protein
MFSMHREAFGGQTRDTYLGSFKPEGERNLGSVIIQELLRTVSTEVALNSSPQKGISLWPFDDVFL